MREQKKLREKERETGEDIQPTVGRHSFRGFGNVFYPEGLLKISHDIHRDTTMASMYSRPGKKDKKELLIDEHHRGNFGIAGFKDGITLEERRPAYMKWFLELQRTEHYGMDFGIVISPAVDVAISPNGDYATQATIMEPRIKPKDIIGIYVNDKQLSPYKHFDDEVAGVFVPTQKDKWGEPVESVLGQFERTRFHFPNKPAEYLLQKYKRPFGIALERQGFSKEELKQIFDLFDQQWEEQWELDTKASGEKFRPAGHLLRQMPAYRKALFRVLVKVGESMSAALGAERYQKMEEIAREFLEKNSPCKEGETLMTGLMRLAEKHQLPIYTVEGDLLWPKKMTQEEVGKLVAEREKGKKE
ncbi:MAG: hypothetical protein Q7R83_00030 [bacterium]|nr:hypothetical protein [bacterium]